MAAAIFAIFGALVGALSGYVAAAAIGAAVYGSIGREMHVGGWGAVLLLLPTAGMAMAFWDLGNWMTRGFKRAPPEKT